jgi:hypothetical protein
MHRFFGWVTTVIGKVPTNFNGEMAQVLFAILFTIGLFLIPHFAIELAKKFLINEK